MVFESSYSFKFVALAFLLLALLSVVSVLKSKNLYSRKARFMALILRLPVLLILVFILLNPVKQDFEESFSGEKVFLIDKSLSMSFGEQTSRYEECKNLLNDVAAASDSDFKVRYFDSGLSENEVGQPDGNSSELGKSLQELLAREKNISDIILMSDGAIHDKLKVAEALKKLVGENTLVSTYVPKRKAFVKNVSIYSFQVPDEATPLTDIPVNFELFSSNFKGRSVEIKVTEEGGQLKARKQVLLQGGLQEVAIDFKSGLKKANYRLEVSQLAGELNYEDNSFEFSLKVQKPTLRVLYMEASTGAHYHYGRKARVPSYEFMAEPMIEAEDIEMDMLLVDQQAGRGGRLYNYKDSSRGFPKTRKELFKYDVVICSDINKSIFTEDQLQWVRELVAERGGGFCMIGGVTSFGNGGWDRTSWEKMIPIDMKDDDLQNYISSPVQNIFVKDQMDHPILKLVDNAVENKEILTKSYTLSGTNRVNAAKPGATILAYMKLYSRTMPLIVVQQYGKGRSMAFTSDSAGSWGLGYMDRWGPGRASNDYYKSFWANTIYWLAANSIAYKNQKISVYLDRLNVYHGDRVQMTVKDFSISSVDSDQCMVYLKGHEGKAVNLDKSLQKKSFEGALHITEDFTVGEKTVVVEVRDTEGKLKAFAEKTLRILEPNRELNNLETDEKYMNELALAGSGKVIETAADLTEVLARKPEKIKKQSQPIWDSWLLMTILLGSLSGEWFYRKYRN